MLWDPPHVRRDWCDQCGSYTACRRCAGCHAILCYRCFMRPHLPIGARQLCYRDLHDNSHNSSTTVHTNRQV